LKHVLLTDHIALEAAQVLESFGGIKAVRTGTPTRDELLAMIPEYDAIIVRSPTRVTAEVIERGVRLKFIGRAGVGVDNIDVEAATRRRIVVINAPRSNTVSTAELTFALMLAVARDLPRAHASVSAGRWQRESFRGMELSGKTLGVVGLGRVGYEVAMRARAFGMGVVAFDPFITPAQAAAIGVRWVALEELLADSDWITLHAPLDEGTRGMIGEKQLAAMKDGVVLVNCARGGLVDEEALVRALDAGKVAAVAFDVFDREPPGRHALFRHPRSVFTPHLGSVTVEAQRRVATDVAESIGLALTGGEIRDAVNRV
jgi:D-3-phosphoglycerate dehydrogenase